jgi:hypothetical protein
VFNATFSNITAISWRPVLVVEEAGVSGENQSPDLTRHIGVPVLCHDLYFHQHMFVLSILLDLLTITASASLFKLFFMSGLCYGQQDITQRSTKTKN